MIKSTIKPEIQQKPAVELEYNDIEAKSYSSIGIEVPGDVLWQERRFLNSVDLRKGEIERNVTLIVRLRAIDYNSPKHERKEYCYYTEDWIGKNIHGVPIHCRDHVEGRYTKRSLRPKLNPKTGDHLYNELDPTKHDLIYTIPWSKKNIDEIIDKSTNTGKDSIKFLVKFSSDDSRSLGYADRLDTRSYFSYEQFATWEFTDLFYFQIAPQGQVWDRKSKSFRLMGAQPAVQPSHIT